MRLALADAGLEAADIDYINAHASSTGLGDQTETAALKLALDDETARTNPDLLDQRRNRSLPRSRRSDRSSSQHPRHPRPDSPPTINYQTVDPACDLDYIPNSARPHHLDVALSNSFGFGGHNAVLAFSRYETGSSR